MCPYPYPFPECLFINGFCPIAPTVPRLFFLIKIAVPLPQKRFHYIRLLQQRTEFFRYDQIYILFEYALGGHLSTVNAAVPDIDHHLTLLRLPTAIAGNSAYNFCASSAEYPGADQDQYRHGQLDLSSYIFHKKLHMIHIRLVYFMCIIWSLCLFDIAVNRIPHIRGLHSGFPECAARQLQLLHHLQLLFQ